MSSSSTITSSSTSSSSSSTASRRMLPNILVSGTPGTGKSSLCEQVATETGLKHISITELVKEKGFHAGRDEKFDTLLIDEAAEDRIVDELEPLMNHQGGILIEAHSTNYFPERWFDLILVLRTDNTLLYDRLQQRGYSQQKLDENITAEIMRVVADEIQECYPEEIIHELSSNNLEDLEQNTARIVKWISNWKDEHPEGIEWFTGPQGKDNNDNTDE